MPLIAPRSARTRSRLLLDVFRLEDRVTPAYAYPVGLTPDIVRHAYGIDAISFNGVVGDGSGQTIAIVDAYDSPTIAADLATFNAMFGTFSNKLDARPVGSFFTKVDQRGGTNYPAPDKGWSGEIALDVEWAHAVAPMANILLVEADSNSTADLFAAVRYAATYPGVTVVSNSYGANEYASEAAIDATFLQPGVSFVVSAGDSGVIESPSSSPNVLSVGGTKLSVRSDGTWQSEVAWTYSSSTDSGGGGGLSQYVPRPSYQDSVLSVVGSHRGTPDVAYNGDPESGVAVIDSYGNGAVAPWDIVGGTSAGAPQWAALLAVTNQGRVLNGLTVLNSTGGTQTLPAVYGLKDGYFHDIKTGTNAYSNRAKVGYDLVTGRGTPLADLLVPKLAGYQLTPTVTAGASPAAITLGGATTLTARVAGNAVEGTPTGSVRFTTVYAGNTVVLGTAPLVNGVASLPTFAFPTTGLNTVTATYLGDDGYLTATGTTPVVVSPSNNTVTVGVAGGSTYGQSVTITATVAGSTNPQTTPTGIVTFQVGSIVLGAATLVNGVATLATTVLPAGSADQVYAVYSGGGTYTTGLGSATVAVAKAPLTVSAVNASRGYGAANPAFTVTTLGTLYNGDTLATALTGAAASAATPASPLGSYAITQGTLDAANYAITFVGGTLTVTPAQLTVTADTQSKVYGAANPVLTYTVTGLAGGDTAASVLSGALATTATQGSGVGSYAVTAGTLAADPNYTLTFVGGTLAVTPAPLTLTASDASRTYGAVNPAFTVTPAGLVNGDTLASAVTGAAGTAATPGSAVGSYAITQGSLAAANYDITFVGGTLTVTRAALALTANNQTKVYGAAVPALTVTPVGLVNGDTLASAVTGGAAAAVTAGTGVDTYAITLGTLAATNYAITFTPGTLAVTPAPLTLAVPDQRRSYGAAVSDLTVTPTGLVNGDTLASAVTGTYATPATLGSPVGSYPVTRGSLAANGNYAVTFVGGTLAIDPARLTVTPDALSKVYGAAVPALTYTVTGLVNGDAASVLSGALATAATAGSGVGSYAVTAGTLAAANYAITVAPGVLSVTPARLTVTPDALSKVYGAAVPALTYTVAGLVNGDAAASVLAGALATAATAGSGVGAYPITQGTLGGVGSNYALTFVPGTLTVTPAPLTVAAGDASRAANEANPAFTSQITGFVNGDTAASLSGALTLTTTAGPRSLPGAYPITPAGLSDPNYAITFAPGTLTVGPIRYAATVTGGGAGVTTAITVTRPDGTVVYTFPAFEPTFTGGVNVAVADVNGDGVDDIVVGAGAGGGPRVRVYSGADFSVLADFFAYETTFRGGVNVAAADVNGDGFADVITGAGDQGGPAVREFSGRDFSLMASFFAFDSAFRNGVTVAAADVNGDGAVEIVTGAGAGGGPVVKVFDGRTSDLLASVYAFDPSNRSGVTVAAGPGYVAAGTGPGAAPAVQVRDGSDLTVVRSQFTPFDPSYTGGVSVRGVAEGRLLVSPTVPTGPAAGVWDPLAGTFLGGVAVG